MASFDYRESEALEVGSRFSSSDAEHRKIWESLDWTNEGAGSEFLGRELAQFPSTVPRLFISHNSADTNVALDVADWCKKRGLDFWLDVLDPKLRAANKLTGIAYARAVAAVIEMALLNCTHVLVVYTDNAAKSRWVPYEYGRVKIRGFRSLQAAAWNLTRRTTLPEYMLLGELFRAEIDVKNWIAHI